MAVGGVGGSLAVGGGSLVEAAELHEAVSEEMVDLTGDLAGELRLRELSDGLKEVALLVCGLASLVCLLIHVSPR